MPWISNDLNTISGMAHHAPEDRMISASVITGSFALIFISLI